MFNKSTICKKHFISSYSRMYFGDLAFGKINEISSKTLLRFTLLRYYVALNGINMNIYFLAVQFASTLINLCLPSHQFMHCQLKRTIKFGIIKRAKNFCSFFSFDVGIIVLKNVVLLKNAIEIN